MMQRSRSSLSTRDLALSALFCAVTAVMAQIVIPLSPVPFSFGIMGVLLTAVVLNMRHAVAAQTTYLLIGAMGVPVFAQFGAGPQKLIGPTGGYLASYLLVALVCGFLFQRVFKKRNLPEVILVLLIGLALCYACGTLWLAFLLKRSFREALAMGVLPFVAFDLIKVLLSALVGVRLRRILLSAGLVES